MNIIMIIENYIFVFKNVVRSFFEFIIRFSCWDAANFVEFSGISLQTG